MTFANKAIFKKAHNFAFHSQNQETYVSGFSQKYSTIWGTNMDTKHTTDEQITGN
jgi:hypothetical protein